MIWNNDYRDPFEQRLAQFRKEKQKVIDTYGEEFYDRNLLRIFDLFWQMTEEYDDCLRRERRRSRRRGK